MRRRLGGLVWRLPQRTASTRWVSGNASSVPVGEQRTAALLSEVLAAARQGDEAAAAEAAVALTRWASKNNAEPAADGVTEPAGAAAPSAEVSPVSVTVVDTAYIDLFGDPPAGSSEAAEAAAANAVLAQCLYLFRAELRGVRRAAAAAVADAVLAVPGARIVDIAGDSSGANAALQIMPAVRPVAAGEVLRRFTACCGAADASLIAALAAETRKGGRPRVAPQTAAAVARAKAAMRSVIDCLLLEAALDDAEVAAIDEAVARLQARADPTAAEAAAEIEHCRRQLVDERLQRVAQGPGAVPRAPRYGLGTLQAGDDAGAETPDARLFAAAVLRALNGPASGAAETPMAAQVREARGADDDSRAVDPVVRECYLPFGAVVRLRVRAR